MGMNGIKRGRGAKRSHSPDEQFQIVNENRSSRAKHARAAKKEQAPIPDNNGLPPVERVRGRPRGHNRTPLSREEQLARNAFYERERRAALAEGWRLLAEAMMSKAPQKQLLREAPPYIKNLQREMKGLEGEEERIRSHNAALQARLAELQTSASSAPMVVERKVMVEESAEVVLMEVHSSELIIDGEFEHDDAVYVVLPEEGQNAVIDVRPEEIDIDELLTTKGNTENVHLSDFDAEGFLLPVEEEVAEAIDVRPHEIDVIGLMCSTEGEEKCDESPPNPIVADAGQDAEDSGVHSPDIEDLIFLTAEEQTFLETWASIEMHEGNGTSSSVPAAFMPFHDLQTGTLNDQDMMDLAMFDELLEQNRARIMT